MPTYEYMCEKCEHEFEREQRISDPPVKTCPACRSRKVKKLISRTSFVLKGGGWYSDLYSSSQAKDTGKDAKPESSSETKPSSSKKSKASGDSSTSDSKTSGSKTSGSKKGKSAA